MADFIAFAQQTVGLSQGGEIQLRHQRRLGSSNLRPPAVCQLDLSALAEAFPTDLILKDGE